MEKQRKRIENMGPEEYLWSSCEVMKRFSAAIWLAAVVTTYGLITNGAPYLGKLSADNFPHSPESRIEQIITNDLSKTPAS